MKDETEQLLAMLMVAAITAMATAMIVRGCSYDSYRMNHVAACLEQGREAEECEVIK